MEPLLDGGGGWFPPLALSLGNKSKAGWGAPSSPCILCPQTWTGVPTVASAWAQSLLSNKLMVTLCLCTNAGEAENKLPWRPRIGRSSRLLAGVDEHPGDKLFWSPGASAAGGAVYKWGQARFLVLLPVGMKEMGTLPGRTAKENRTDPRFPPWQAGLQE